MLHVLFCISMMHRCQFLIFVFVGFTKCIDSKRFLEKKTCNQNVSVFTDKIWDWIFIFCIPKLQQKRELSVALNFCPLFQIYESLLSEITWKFKMYFVSKMVKQYIMSQRSFGHRKRLLWNLWKMKLNIYKH